MFAAMVPRAAGGGRHERRKHFAPMMAASILFALAPCVSASRVTASRVTAPRFKASTFDHIMQQRTITAAAYAGTPLASGDTVARTKVLTSLARIVDAERYPEAAIVAASIGAGRGMMHRQSSWHLSHSWERDGVRVACKSAQLVWSTATSTWTLQFKAVKLNWDVFDELQLAVYTPGGVHLYLHDMQQGASSSGKATDLTGSQLVFVGARHESDLDASVDCILTKLSAEGGCRPIAHVAFDDPRMLRAQGENPPSRTTTAYERVPLGDVSASWRGVLLGKLALCLDSELQPRATITTPDTQHKSAYGWRRGETRVAFKSAKLTWDSTGRHWRVQFQRVQFNHADGSSAFDELLLAVYAPTGLYLYRHDGRFGVSTPRNTTKGSLGATINIYAPCGVDEWQPALETVLSKLDGGGCGCVAVVEW